jgi:hypothetical protein
MFALIQFLLSALTVALAAGPPPAAPSAQPYSWEQSQAKVTADGDLEWAPLPFVYQAGSSVRYIDYENGNDANPGSRNQPWKHHPWDAQATGKSAECTGIQTYVFKRGVVYRGALVAKESGRPGNPIRLTSDPSWGTGDASIYGSRRITGGWTRADARSAPGIPSPEAVWYQDIGTDFTPHSVWMVSGGVITRIPLARKPHWKVATLDDVKSEWYDFDGIDPVNVASDGKQVPRYWASDAAHLTAQDANAYAGGTVWSEYEFVMGDPYPTPIEAYDPVRHAIRLAGPFGDARTNYKPVLHGRYFLENLPQFLDAPGEYYLVQQGPLAGRLYVRLPGEQDPNRVDIEIAERPTLVDLRDQSYIHVSGLTFRFQNVLTLYVNTQSDWVIDHTRNTDIACVKAVGACKDIRVANCKFEHIVRAFLMASGGEGIADEIAFDDNEIQYTDYGAIVVSNRGGTPPAGNLYKVEIMRNRLYEIGRRTFMGDHGHALRVDEAIVSEVAGNILDHCWGAGLFIFGGKGRVDITRPLERVIMHDNKVTYALLNTNDWGEIEFWRNGPGYIYNNIAGAPGGYRRYRDLAIQTPEKRTHLTARFGFPYYLDGGLKAYLFNNIAWGKSSDLTSPLCATSAFHEVVGFQNEFFNNTIYRTAAPFRRTQSAGARTAYLGNLIMEPSEVVFRHADITAPEDTNLLREGVQHYPTETVAYANNVIVGRSRVFGYFDLDKSYATLEDFRAGLVKVGAVASQTGWQVDESPVMDAENHDFRPRAGSAVIGRGVKFFVPWSLSAVVGEWPFYKLPADPTRIMGENWYLTEEYKQRNTFYLIPHNDLKAHNVAADDYIKGTLEDWTEGALSLNGRDQFCSISDAELRTTPGGERSHSRNLDMDTNNFLIEAVFRSQPGHTGGGLVSKLDAAGYALEIDQAGRVRLRLVAGAGSKNEYSRASLVPVNDGQWHHVIAEVDRNARESIRIYIDGKPAGGRVSGTKLAPNASLTNTADFLVGKGPAGNFFVGAIDYLRVSRGTLADALTTIDELYRWEFDGPFLRDFRGQAPTGARRDAGAFEYTP